ncbi:hypothetical protein ACWGJP_10590 [Microbacterium sp. NPDC055903]
MSEPTAGGITVKVLTGRTAASLQRYRDSTKEGQEPHLLATTRHCSHDVEMQIAEWKRVREEHGTQGARRTEKATYESVDPDTGMHASGQRGTHVRYHDGKRWRKRLAGPGETPTHLRIEAGDLVVKESEAVHTIYAASADIVNPENPEDIERFWAAVNAARDALYPGLQESRWLERNGESGLVHVHVASNATIYEAFTLDGAHYAAGKKMAGDLTRVHSIRAAFEQHLDAHPELGLRQSLARVGTQEYMDAQQRDGQKSYWDQKRGRESSQNRIRLEVAEALQDETVVDHDSFVAEMRSRGIVVDEIGLRRGKPGKNHDYRYRVATGKRSVRGGTLGPGFTYSTIGEQLDRKAQGLELKPLVIRQQTGPSKPLPIEQVDGQPLSAQEQAELEQLKADVEALAQAEREQQAAELSTGDGHEQPLSALERAKKQMQEWRDSGEDEAEFERLRAEREAAAATAQAKSETAAPAEAPAEDKRRLLITRAEEAHEPAETQVAPEEFRSRLRELRGRNPKAQARLDALIALDEDYAGRFERGELPDPEFERRATQIGIGRDTLEGKLGVRFHPAVTSHFERRETAKAVGRREFELARDSDSTDDYQAHLARSTKARELTRAGEYDRAATMSSERPGSMRGTEAPEPAATSRTAAQQRLLDKQMRQRRDNQKATETESQGMEM